MNRRSFITALAGAAVTIASGFPHKANSEVRYSEPPRPEEYRMPDGFEVVENVQPVDSDSPAFRVRKWRNGDIVASRTHTISFYGQNSSDKVQSFIRERIMETIKELETA